MIKCALQKNIRNLYYINVNGNCEMKMKTMCEWIRNEECDLLFVSETWFVNQEENMLNPFVYCSTPWIKKSTGHANAGLYMMCKPSIGGMIADCVINEYFIAILINGDWIVGVYLPPRLSCEEITEVLRKLPQNCKFVLGDFNFKPRRVDERHHVIYERMNELNLSLCQAPQQTGWDHLFSREHVNWKYNRLSKEYFMTDHGRMEVVLPISNVQDDCPQPLAPKKYAFSLLYQEKVQIAMLYFYENVEVATMEVKLDVAIKELSEMKTRSNAKKLINTVYDEYLLSITNICDAFLPTYTNDNVGHLPQTKVIANESTTQAIRSFKRSRRSKQVKLKSRDITKSPLKEAYEHYSDIFKDEICPSMKYYKWDESRILTDIKGLKKKIMKYPSWKSPGPDCVDGRMLKCLSRSKNFLIITTRIFNLLYAASLTPDSWNTSTVHLLAKDPHQPYVNLTRPISLTCILRRIFEKLINQKFAQEQLSWIKLQKTQAGFRNGYSCLSQILVVDELTRKKNGITCFLDLKGAYDRVNFRIMMEILEKRGCPRQDVSLISSLMFEEVFSVITCNQTNHPVPVIRRRGLFQGSILSPLLFNVFIDDLAKRMNEKEKDSCHLYADDVAITCLKQKLPSLLRICDEWSRENKMEWNLAKSGVLVDDNENFPMFTLSDQLSNDIARDQSYDTSCVSRDMSRDDQSLDDEDKIKLLTSIKENANPTREDEIVRNSFPEFSVQQHTRLYQENNINAAIPRVKEYEYLGVPFNKKGADWKKHLINLNKKEENMLKSVLMESSSWNGKTRLAIYKSFVRSVGEYCLPLGLHWMSLQPKEIQEEISLMQKKTYQDELDWLTMSNNTNRIAESITGLGSLSFRHEALKASLTRHLKKLSPLNLVNELKQNINPLLMLGNSRSIISNCFTSRTYSRYLTEVEQQRNNGSTTTMAWKSFLRRLCKEDMDQNQGLLHSYILQGDRRPNLVEKCMLINNHKNCELLVKWRMNKFTFGKKCFNDHPLTRSCFIKCNIQNRRFTEEEHTDFAVTIRTIEAKQKNHNYNYIDFLIHKEKYEEACTDLRRFYCR